MVAYVVVMMVESERAVSGQPRNVYIFLGPPILVPDLAIV